jgi:hypothetical protein
MIGSVSTPSPSFSSAKGSNGLGSVHVSKPEVHAMPALAAIRSFAIAVAGLLLGLLIAAMAAPIAAYAQAPTAAPVPASPAKPADAGKQPVDNDAKTVSIIVYGNDPCPQSQGDEIVVCAREPESERYRIPKRFRGKKEQAAPNNSWANKSTGADEASRTGAGLPDTCSAVGSGGQSGCFHQFQSQMAQQRRLQKQQQQDNSAGTPDD